MKPRRSILSVPANVEKFHAKALNSKVDVIMFDLEDSVALEKKSDARDILSQVLASIETNKNISYRINPIDSKFAVDDLLIINKIIEKIDSIVIPKVESVSDIHFVDKFLNSIELKLNKKRRIKLEASIETAKGMANISEIARSSDRLISLVFGIADYTASLGASLVSISGHGENDEKIYPGHRWHYALSNIVIAAKANDLLAIDAPFGNFKDNSGLISSCQISRALGIDGKWAIHPEQIESINKIFSPTEDEIKFAVKIIEAANQSNEIGKGSVQIDGKMIDQATIRLADKVYQNAKKLKLI